MSGKEQGHIQSQVWNPSLLATVTPPGHLKSCEEEQEDEEDVQAGEGEADVEHLLEKNYGSRLIDQEPEC